MTRCALKQAVCCLHNVLIVHHSLWVSLGASEKESPWEMASGKKLEILKDLVEEQIRGLLLGMNRQKVEQHPTFHHGQ